MRKTKLQAIENANKSLHKRVLKEENSQYSEWDYYLNRLKEQESFNRDDLRVILEAIYRNSYREGKSSMLDLMRYFNLADSFN